MTLDLVLAVSFTESMSPFSKLQLTGLLIALSGSSVLALEPGVKGKSGGKVLGVSVVRVYETRRYTAKGDAYSGDITVEVDINSGIETAQLLAVELTSAKDDKGTDLLNPKRITFEAKGRSFTELQTPPTASLRLEVPAREAKEISEIKGTATFQDNSLAAKPVDLSGFRKSPGEFVKNEVLEKYGISVAFLDEETFDEKGAALILEQLGKNLGEPDGDAKKAMVAPMKAVFQVAKVGMFVVKDPEEKFLKIEGLGADGEVSFFAQSALNGLWMLHPKDRETELKTVRIYINSKEAEFTKEFVLKNVKLP